MRSIYILFWISFISGCAALPSIDSLHKDHDGEVRLQTVFSNILTANLHVCPVHRKDYGFNAVWLKRIAETETSQIWKEAFNLKDKPKVITVIPDGAAERGGLQIGDTILSVNDFQWSASDKEQKNFEKELNSAFLLPTMRLVVQRNKDKLALLFTGNDICDVYIHIVNGEGASAYTSNNNHVFIERGMEELMSEDSELAYVVAHEISHAIYGHAAPERKRDLKDKDIRFSMEKEADAMAIRLMVNAGYDTAGAAAAVKKFDYESRGPITRWLDYYGSYMSTEQRIEFLKTTVDEVLK